MLKALSVYLLVSSCLHRTTCQTAPAPAAANQSLISPAASSPLLTLKAVINAPAAAPSTSSPVHTCELEVLTLLGWQHAYDPAGYSIEAVLPTNCSSQTWQSLGCLGHLINLTLTGSLPDLPDSWAANGSFPALQTMNFSNTDLVGTLPEVWAQSTAFPQLQLLNLTMTGLSGTLPAAWGQAGAFAHLLELHVADTNTSGIPASFWQHAQMSCRCCGYCCEHYALSSL